MIIDTTNSNIAQIGSVDESRAFAGAVPSFG